MADITIDTVVSSSTPKAARAVVFTGPLTGYAFHIKSAAPSVLQYKKTTDGGATWGSNVQVNTSSDNASAFDIWFDKWTPGDGGSLIHVWWIDRDDATVRYRTLDTASDTLGTERTIFTGVSATTDDGAIVSGTKARGGNLLCVFNIDTGAETGTYRSTDAGANWGSRTDINEAANDWFALYPGNEADNQDVWVLFEDRSTDQLTLKVHDDSANTNSESSNIVTVADTSNTWYPFAASIRLSDGHLIAAVWTERDQATADFRVFDINGTGSISELAALATNIDDSYFPSVFIDQSTDDLYVAYNGKLDGSETLGTATTIFYRKSTDAGASWGAETAYSANTSGTAYFRTWTDLGGISTRFAVVWRDSPAGADFTNFDNSVAIIVNNTAAGTPALPNLTAAGAGVMLPVAAGTPHLPGLRAAGQGQSFSGQATGAVSLPSLTASGSSPYGSQVAGDYVLEVDWDGDGDFDEAIEDITAYATDVQTSTGRDYASNLTGKTSAGRLVAQLNNADSRFAPFNASSPLIGLMLPGRKVRLRTAASVPFDPIVLCQDGFNRADATGLGDAETGGTWGTPATALDVANQRAVAHTSAVNSVDTSLLTAAADCYAQVRCVQGLGSGAVATLNLIVRYEDANNLVRATIDPAAGTLALVERDGGTDTTLFTTAIEMRDGRYLGLRALDDTVTLYLDGVPLAARTVVATGTDVGLRQTLWESPAIRPEFDDFKVWTGLVAAGEETDGVIWTGLLAELKPDVAAGVKTATLTAEGPLAGLAAVPVLAPVSSGSATGYLVGNILGEAGYLNPPGPIEIGDLTTGVYAPADADGLTLARQLEAAEVGFIFETQEGAIGYRSRQARFLEQTSKATFSDDSATAGLRFGPIDESDWNKELFNRATASPSPYSIGTEATLWTDPGPYALAPGESVDLVASYSNRVQAWTGHSRDVTEPGGDPVFESVATQTFASTASLGVTVPAVSIGDLLVVLIAGNSFNIATPAAPAGFTKYGLLGTVSIYAKPITAGAGSGTITFTAPQAARWAVQVIRVSSWFEALADGFQVVEGASSDGRVPITPSWGAVPTMYIGVLAWLASAVETNTSYPTGYSDGTLVQDTTNPRVNVASAHRQASVATELHDGFVFNPAVSSSYRSHMIAIRGATETAPTSVADDSPAGPSGAFTISYDAGVGGAVQYHRNIAATGVPIETADQATIVRNDLVSQGKFGLRAFPEPPALFASAAEATAWCDLVLARAGDPVPILQGTFIANRDASHMAAACNRRVGDRVTIDADDNSGLGISEDFFIEAIHHHLSNGNTRHEVVWELSPASVTDS